MGPSKPAAMNTNTINTITTVHTILPVLFIRFNLGEYTSTIMPSPLMVGLNDGSNGWIGFEHAGSPVRDLVFVLASLFTSAVRLLCRGVYSCCPYSLDFRLVFRPTAIYSGNT